MNVLSNYFSVLEPSIKALDLKTAMKVNQNLQAQSYLQRQSISYGYPSIWEIETTNRCAMTCNHCPRTALHQRTIVDMDIELFKKIISQTRPFAQGFRSNVPTIPLLHYGEPALYPHFGESIAYCKEHGLKVLISSTAPAFNDRALKEAVESRLDKLWLIFDGMDNETFRKIRGKAASFTKGMEQLKKLMAYKIEMKSSLPHITVIMIKHPYNKHQWEEFKSFFSDMEGVDYYLAHFSVFAGRVTEIKGLQEKIADDPEEKKEIQRVKSLNGYTCFYPWNSVSVLADGRVVPCCRDVNGDYILGDLNIESLLDIWNGEKMQILRNEFLKGNRNNTLCSNCSEGSLEIGVPHCDGNGIKK